MMSCLLSEKKWDAKSCFSFSQKHPPRHKGDIRMKTDQLTRRIEELSEKLKPVASEGIRLDFYSFTEPEQLVILKNTELSEKCNVKWTKELITANQDLIVKFNGILISRTVEVFLFVMPRAMMLSRKHFFLPNQ
jgi:hypothetical protein